jgi:hypothetical protein
MSVTIGPAAIRWYVAHTDNSPGHPSAGYESDSPFWLVEAIRSSVVERDPQRCRKDNNILLASSKST